MSNANTTACIIPTLRYRDAPSAINWLCKAFSFKERLVVPGEGGAIAHAQLMFRNNMIMVSSVADGAYDNAVKPPDGFATQSPYVIVDDADTHYATAILAGAEIIVDIEDQSYGGRGYTCRDPEGHIWNFGTYDPFATT